MITSTLRFLLSVALTFVCFNTFAVSPPPKEGGQTPSPTKSPTATPKPTPAGAIDEKLFSGMQWRQIGPFRGDRKSTRLNSSHGYISYAVFCLKKKKNTRDKLTGARI